MNEQVTQHHGERLFGGALLASGVGLMLLAIFGIHRGGIGLVVFASGGVVASLGIAGLGIKPKAQGSYLDHTGNDSETGEPTSQFS